MGTEKNWYVFHFGSHFDITNKTQKTADAWFPGRLSYGMAKNPVDYLAAVQRWAEGGVVLSLQTFFSCHKGHWAKALQRWTEFKKEVLYKNLASICQVNLR